MSATRRSRHDLHPGLRALFALLATLACRDAPHPAARATAEAPDATPPWTSHLNEPTAPRGMVWIPEGALIAGTPVGRIPRIADAELPGQPVGLHGFFVHAVPD